MDRSFGTVSSCLIIWLAASQSTFAQTPPAPSPPPTTPQPAAPPAASDAAAERVATELDRLDAWLGDNPNGDRWRRHLSTDELRGELAKGRQADPAAVARVLQRLRGPAKGLERDQFEAVRKSVTNWLAELRRQYAGDLGKLAWASRGDHEPITPEQFAEVRANLRRAAAELLSRLGNDAPLARSWKKYLHWELLEPHLRDDFQASNATLADLDLVLRRLRSNQPGLELPVFRNVAAALARYRAQASWAEVAKSRDSRPDYERRIAALGESLQRHLERPTSETSRQVARVFSVIEGLGQSPEFVAAIRRQLARPNIYAGVSKKLILALPDRKIDAQRDVRDCILGVAQFGTAHTTGSVRYEVAPADSSVDVLVYLQGEAHSRTRGYKKPAKVNARGVTVFSAVKTVSINDEVFTSTPAQATADTRSRILSVQKTGGQFGARLVQKIGWKRAHEQKRASEIVAAQHTEVRVEREFDETVAKDLADLRQRYETKIRAPLVRRDVFPEHLKMQSTVAGVVLEAVFAGRHQLGAPNAPPAPLPGHDIQLQIHESAVNNYLPLALASARIQQDTAENPPDLQGDVPNWLKAFSAARPGLAAAVQSGTEIVEEAVERIEDIQDLEEGPPTPETGAAAKAPPFKPYSITLNADAPVGARFDDGKITIRIRAAKLASDDAEYENWDFIVTYQITTNGDQILLKRVGDIEVFPTGFDPAWDKQLTAQQSGFRSTLAKNMNARAKAGQSFPPEIPIQPVRISRFGVMVLRELVADDGWLTIGWGLPYAGSASATAPTPAPANPPAPPVVPSTAPVPK